MFVCLFSFRQVRLMYLNLAVYIKIDDIIFFFSNLNVPDFESGASLYDLPLQLFFPCHPDCFMISFSHEV